MAVALGSGAAEVVSLSLEGTGVSWAAAAAAAARRGRSVRGVAAGVDSVFGVEAVRGGGREGVAFSSPGTGVATAA